MTRKNNYKIKSDPLQQTPNDLPYPDIEAGKPEIDELGKQNFQKKSNGLKFWKKKVKEFSLSLN